MNEIITSREELLWAKLAGRDADISTMTPPVYANLVEKFMAETAERIDNAGSGGGDETITINTELGNVPETSDGYVVELDDAKFAKITRESEITINGREMIVVPDTEKVEFTYNLDLESGEPTGTPAIYFEVDNATATYITDVDPSNSTLSIVVKNRKGGGGAGLPEVTEDDNGKVLGVVDGAWNKTAMDSVLVVTANVDFDLGVVFSPSKAAKSIYDANQAGKIVVGRFTHTKSGVEHITDMLLKSCFESGVHLYT